MQNPSTSNLISKGFSLAFLNIWRNKFLSIATIFVIGTIIFIFNIILTVDFVAKDALSDLSKKIDVTVYLKEDATFKDAQEIITDILQLDGITEATYSSKEDALEKIKLTHPDITVAFEKYNLGNPLPASINITTADPSFHESIDQYLNQDKYLLYLSNIQSGSTSTNDTILTSVSKNLAALTDFAKQIIFWLILIFIIGGALIILNAVQITIFNRRKEISVMKLVGSPNWFIRFPFIIESVVYGILAVVLSFIMLLLLSKNIEILSSNTNFYLIFLIELGITILICTLSSILAVHEYMQKKLL